MSRKIIPVFALTILSVLFCFPVFSTGAPEEQNRTLTVAIAGNIETLCANFSYYAISNMISWNIGDQWFEYVYEDTGEGYSKPNGAKDLQGYAIESWDISGDRMSITLHVRRGQKFPMTGNEMTANDIIWWLDAGRPTKGGINFFLVNCNILSWEKTGPYDVRLQLGQPVTDEFFKLLRGHTTQVLDSTEIKKHITDQDPWGMEWLAKNYAANGEFIVESWDPGVQMVLKANKQYWKGPAFFDKVVLKVVPSSATRALLLKNGSVDVALDLTSEQYAELSTVSGVRVRTIPSRITQPVFLNNKKEPFSNKKLRQAMSYLIPYDRIVNEFYKGQAQRVYSVLPSGSAFVDRSFWKYEHDVKTAKTLMAEAGYPDGFAFALNIKSGDALSEKMAVFLQEAFKEANVQMEIRPVSPAVFAEEEATGKYEAEFYSSFHANLDAPFYTLYQFTSKAATNRCKYINPELDEIYEKSKHVTDPKEIKRLTSRWQQILVEDAASLWIANVPAQYAMRDDIEGFTFTIDTGWWFYSLRKK